MSVIGKKMVDSVKEFAECGHERWKCESCGCRTSTETLQNTAFINMLEGEIESLHRALDAAKAFIDSHVADPDITKTMIERYAEYEAALAAAPAQEESE